MRMIFKRSYIIAIGLHMNVNICTFISNINLGPSQVISHAYKFTQLATDQTLPVAILIIVVVHSCILNKACIYCTCWTQNVLDYIPSLPCTKPTLNKFQRLRMHYL